MLDAVAGPESRKDRRLFILMSFRNKDRDWFSDYFLCGVTKDSLRTLVPTRNYAVECLADDGVISRLNKCSQPVLCELRAFEVSDLTLLCAHARSLLVLRRVLTGGNRGARIIARLPTKDHKRAHQASFLMCSLCVFVARS